VSATGRSAAIYRAWPRWARIALPIVAAALIIGTIGSATGPKKSRVRASTATPTTTVVSTTSGPPPGPTDPPASVLAATGLSAPPGLIVQDPTLTPGATFVGVTAAEVCVAGYAARVRNVPPAEKNEVFAEYHLVDTPGAYEVDHLISLELGGSNDIRNLWPEPYAGRYGAHTKDKVENYLHDQVCSGTMSLTAAQVGIATHWWAYLGSVGLSLPAAPAAGPRTATSPPATSAPGTEPTPPATSPQTGPQAAKPGAYCSPEGSTGMSPDGVPMSCVPRGCDGATYKDARDHWRRTTC